MKPKPSKAPALDIRIDTKSGGVYLGLREHLRAARTEVKQEWPLVAVDYSRSGQLIGIEAVGMPEINIGEVLRIAGVTLTATTMRSATLHPEPAQIAAMA
jgi:hypothetical protein